MIFKGIITLSGVRTFLIAEDTLMYVNEKFELFQNNSLLSHNVLDTGYTVFNGKIIFLTNSTTVIDNEVFENLSYVINSGNIYANTIVFSGDFNLNYPNFSYIYYLYDLNSKQKSLICEFENLFYFFRHEEAIFFCNKTQIHAYTLPAAQPLWQFDLGSLGNYQTITNETKAYEVRKFLGVSENQLWVLMSNDELLVLDMNTGNLINKIAEIPVQQMNEYTCNRLGNCMLLDESEGKIKGFVHFVYWELDTKSLEITTFNLKDTLTENNLFGIMNVLEFCRSETHLFVPMKQIDENGSVWSFLVAVNKETKQIDWKHQLPWTGNNIPQYANGKLYQLDNDNTLHIFEKENA